MATATNGATPGPEQQENHADERENQADGLQNGNLGDQADDEQNGTENDHRLSLEVT